MGETAVFQIIKTNIQPIIEQTGIDALILTDLYVLTAQAGHTVKLGWHKDVTTGTHAFQLPLLTGDNIHQLVPKTHLREMNEAEIVSRNSGGEQMPNAIKIELRVGDILLRSPTILHRGYTKNSPDRKTIVGRFK